MMAAETGQQKAFSRSSNELKNIVKNPVVTVAVAGMTNNKVYAWRGHKIGRFAVVQRTTLLQLL